MVNFGGRKSLYKSFTPFVDFVHRYDWIALLDVDEVIVPRKHNSWAEMLEEVGARSISIFNLLSAVHF